METFSFSAKGERGNNQDFILSRQLSPDRSVHLVADGMGGFSHGEIASLVACETIFDFLLSKTQEANVNDLLKKSVAFANEVILNKRKELGVKIGTTIAGTLIEGAKVYFFWLGDVRIHLFRDGKLLFRSEDHSLITEMENRGHVSAIDTERYGHIVTRALMGEVIEKELEIRCFDLLKGDELILCSDGFWHNFDIEKISNLPLADIQTHIDNTTGFFNDNYSILRISF